MTTVVQGWLTGLAGPLALAALVWGAGVVRRDASLVDRFWPLLVLSAAVPASFGAGPLPWVVIAMWTIAGIWGLRLALHLTVRNWGHGEDRRYRAMRARHGDAFWWKSLVIVFGLQAMLAWIIAQPLIVAAGIGRATLDIGPVASALAVGGLLLAAGGFAFEAVADAQMARFRRDRAGTSDDAVMDRGLWRLSRHPNYFGEACVWWGLAIAAVAVVSAEGFGWPVVAALVSPLLLTWLLLRVSGVALTEQDIADRRPAYRRYQSTTPAFFPRWPRAESTRTSP